MLYKKAQAIYNFLLGLKDMSKQVDTKMAVVKSAYVGMCVLSRVLSKSRGRKKTRENFVLQVKS